MTTENDQQALPPSLVRAMEQANELTKQAKRDLSAGQTDTALAKLESVKVLVQEIAQISPEVATIIVALQEGYTTMTMTENETTTVTKVVERKIFGMHVATDIVPFTDQKTVKREIKFSRD